MFYFTRDNDQENRRCVVAFAPTFAVTYAHSGNLILRKRICEDGKIVAQGSVFSVNSFDTDENGKSQKTVGTICILKKYFNF